MDNPKDPLPETLPLTIKEKVRLAKTIDPVTWNRAVEEILAVRDNHYPPDWRAFAPGLGYGALIEWA